MAKNMKKTYKNQALLKSYPQENEEKDIFFTDNPLYFLEKKRLIHRLIHRNKKEGGDSEKISPPPSEIFSP